jgi:ATP-binding cassette subfamily B protein
VPAFIGEAHFNAQSYSLNYARTAERREIDFVRQTAASAETAARDQTSDSIAS